MDCCFVINVKVHVGTHGEGHSQIRGEVRHKLNESLVVRHFLLLEEAAQLTTLPV